MLVMLAVLSLQEISCLNINWTGKKDRDQFKPK